MSRHRLRIRATAMTVIIALTLAAGARAAADKDFGIVIDPEIASSPDTRYQSAWLAYSLAKIATLEKQLDEHPGQVQVNDYVVELAGRSALAKYWRDTWPAGNAAGNAYLDRLVEIADAGLMEEHVLGTFGQPGWTVSAADFPGITPPDFVAWTADHPVDITSATVTVASTSKRVTDVAPGASLPDAERFLPSKVPCAESMNGLRDAATRWKAEETLLPGAPVAAASRADMLDLIARLRDQDPYRKRGITFVSDNVAHLIYLAGFCAVDMQKPEEAQQFLTAAAELSPYAPWVKFELAQTYISLKQFDAAEAIIDQVFSMTEDRCHLGHGWRKRGYIRFEQGRLEEARAAYKRSLDYDPFSEVAASELDLLETEITRHGGNPEPYTAPAPAEQIITHCNSSTWL